MRWIWTEVRKQEETMGKRMRRRRKKSRNKLHSQQLCPVAGCNRQKRMTMAGGGGKARLMGWVPT
jgi:hypothetical protein